ncbi:hypothetical protein ACFLUW_00725 [Chloroflexota bacterium]
MNDLRTIQPLQELEDLITALPASSNTPSLENRNATEVKVYPQNYTVTEHKGLFKGNVEKIELTIPSGTSIGRMIGFTAEVEDKLSNYDGQISILGVHRFSNRGTVITIGIRDFELSNIINKLNNMIQVETVVEGPLVITPAPIIGLLNNLGKQTSTVVRPIQNIQVILRDLDIVKKEAVTILN